ncbi:hypothetical protein JCM12294_29780 [Desulfocicer niacini]
MQANRKILEGKQHPDRDAQFHCINEQVAEFQDSGQPVISVDAKKKEIQNLSNELGIDIQICHFPSGARKWNKIEHQMFSFMSKNWRGRPLESLATIVNLIVNTTTKKGLKIKTDVDSSEYKSGIKVTDEEMASLNILRDEFHGEWNYKIKPKNRFAHQFKRIGYFYSKP